MPDSAALTAADIARLAGVTRATVSNWRRRHADFPAPSGGTDASPAYDRAEVEEWLAARGALPELPPDEQLWRRVQEESANGDFGETVRRVITEAAREGTPADVLDLLITRYAGASAGRVSLTTRDVADLMTSFVHPERSVVLDPACGTGELLAAAARRGAVSLHGQELDADLAELAGARLTVPDGNYASDVRAGDSLRDDQFRGLEADVVLCHPPFGQRDWGQEELALDRRWDYGLPPKTEPELAWVQHALAHLRPGGRAVLLMPPAAASRPAGRRIRAELLRRGAIRAVVALAPGAVYPPHVGPHLWVLERPLGTSPDPRVLMIESSEAEVAQSPDIALAAWRAFMGGEAEAEPGLWRSVPVIDLLDDSVDLTPARHVGIRAAEGSPREVVKAAGASRARLTALLARLGESLSGDDWTVADTTLPGNRAGWREVTTAELTRSGTVEIHRASAAGKAGDAPRIREGDVMVPVSAAGPFAVRVARLDEDGTELRRGLYLIRPDPEMIDPWFLAGFLASPANAQQALYGTTSSRVDVRRLTVPLLPLDDQRRYGAAFRRLREFTATAEELAGQARELTELLGNSLAGGMLLPSDEKDR